MKKIYIPILILLALVGCNPVEKTISVPEFLHDPELIKTTRAWCSTNPAERQQLPNCINSNSAGLKRNFMSCYKNGVTDHACVDEYVNKYLNK